jgi:signal peptidase I
MMPPRLMNIFRRMYAASLYAYPREFRLQYGGEMRRLFHDRCRDLARGASGMRLLRFAAHSVLDWFTSLLAERKASARSVMRGPVAEWGFTLLIYLFTTTTLVQAYVIPTGSMEGSLKVGDHILVDKVAYAKPGPPVFPYRDVQRGDIIAFVYPEDSRQTFVKRVLGLPGDRLRLVDKQLIRNGQCLDEPYTQHIDSGIDAYRDNFPSSIQAFATPRGADMLAHHVTDGEVIVPPGMLFALGDNRDNSLDSRYWGFVPRENVVGEPVLVYWSYDAPERDLAQWTLHHVLDVGLHFFTKTRWERTWTVPRRQEAAVKEDCGSR